MLTLSVLAGLTACDNDYTLAYVYAPSETATTSGLINAYGIDNQTPVPCACSLIRLFLQVDASPSRWLPLRTVSTSM